MFFMISSWTKMVASKADSRSLVSIRVALETRMGLKFLSLPQG